MSHWFSVKTRFESKKALMKAAEAMGYYMRHRTKCRGYGGQTTKCDLVMKLPGDYDIGFQKQPDGAYAVVADFWDNHISKYLADPNVLKKVEEMYPEIEKQQGYKAAEANMADAKISKFTKLYNYFLMQEIAQVQGLQYTEAILEDGSIRIEMTGEPYLKGVL